MLKKHLVRPGATAIVAVLAFSSTSLLAQEVTAPVDAPAAAEPSPEPAASEPAATSSETVTTTTVTESESGATAAPVVKKSTRTVTRTPARRAAPVAARAAPAPAAAAAAPAAPEMAMTAPVEPVAPVAADVPAPAAEPTASAAAVDGDAVEYAFGGALAALVLGGAAVAATRRRRRNREEEVSAPLAVAPVAPAAPVARHDPVPHAVAQNRSAFAWGQQTPATNRMTPTALAKMGPTPDNPSLSLKKRLKRAAFFEQRDRAAAAGKAVPVPRAAGIPKRAVDALRNVAMPHQGTLQPA